jgi:hypothetical protein
MTRMKTPPFAGIMKAPQKVSLDGISNRHIGEGNRRATPADRLSITEDC